MSRVRGGLGEARQSKVGDSVLGEVTLGGLEPVDCLWEDERRGRKGRGIPRVSSAKYLPLRWLLTQRKTERKAGRPKGLNFELKTSNRWKVSLYALRVSAVLCGCAV